MRLFAVFAALLVIPALAYLPGVAPIDYLKNEPIQVLVDAASSDEAIALPIQYFEFPVCKPSREHREEIVENLGQILYGERIEMSNYVVRMRTDTKCRVLTCEAEDGVGGIKYASNMTSNEANDMFSYIAQSYYASWVLDNLPSAGTSSEEEVIEIGFPLGQVIVPEDKSEPTKAVLYNHHTLKIQYNLHYKDDPNKARVVFFEVIPRSIDWKAIQKTHPEMYESVNHTYEFTDPSFAGERVQHDYERRIVPSVCSSLSTATPELILEKGKAMEGIVWTYDVQFVENTKVAWASRWDIYLKAQRIEIHWFSILYSVLIVLFLSGMVAMILLRVLSRDVRRYNELHNSEDAQEETGWKLVYADVFRPPRCASFLSVLVGSGVQVFGMTLVTLTFALFGFLSPAHRGGFMTAALIFFVFMGLFAGYAAARFYKNFDGTSWKCLTLKTAIYFPGVIFLLFFIMNFFIWGERSSRAVPFGTMVALVALWFGISVPLVFLGAFFGFRKRKPELVCKPNQIPRQIPPQRFYMKPIFTILTAGILPFGAVFIELFFILSNLWQRQVYYMFGFLFVVFLILIITCAEITIVMCYFHLCSEDYHWWWRSFLTSGSPAIYLFLYSIFYFATQLHVHKFVSGLLFFGYTLMFSIIFFLLTGCIGFVACYVFIRRIYAAIKIN